MYLSDSFPTSYELYLVHIFRLLLSTSPRHLPLFPVLLAFYSYRSPVAASEKKHDCLFN